MAEVNDKKVQTVIAHLEGRDPQDRVKVWTAAGTVYGYVKASMNYGQLMMVELDGGGIYRAARIHVSHVCR